MKKYSVYVWMAICAIIMFSLSWVIPGLNALAAIAIGVAMGLAMGSEPVSCHLPWQRRREESHDHRAE